MTSFPEPAAAAAPTEDPRSLDQVVAGLSRRLDAARIGTGDLAELRRMSASDFPPAFWRFYLEAVPRDLREPGGRPDYRLDRAWAALIRAMAEMAPNPLDFQVSFGRALASVGYSEHRFVRLLRAEGGDLARELRVAARRLALGGAGRANWMAPAHLLLAGLVPCPKRESVTHGLARDFFREQARLA